ncbi:ribosome biogenesis GTPase Der [Aminivibrio sp.]|jgi:GTP-binding protein|uniref:ribosome biogenesis GTPase Der n=1 Tax=Aminivibrio sp. TaxID=1872489 RepID=UPI0016A74675|nr:ribosome biogenesis GTPase Der [Synergistaceae bacterium]MDD4020551.1 ribosome biogenesis GTPase Der [Synergistaceae bacterium]MDD4612341.1 ribosome biogenesis GTPase Der [Synergistaceae bacterium]NCC58526.1 ribosome biogenesis GTPase Der [Synergistales bacterium]NLO59426.1 ribosome biogenesis GTPase Der [Synergistaceae bacterium]
MPVVSIIGRPNVGKSSLFNRLTGRREAIVDDMPGVTRDRLYGEAEWRDRKFYVVDTGGFLAKDEHAFVHGMRQQVRTALAESDVVLFMIDGREGPTWMDDDVADMLRKSGKPVIVVANKIDDSIHEDLVYQAYSLGFDEVIGISAEHKRNIYDLLDLVIEKLPKDEPMAEASSEVRVAIVGKPNVGKSSLLNYLAGEERSLVTDIPGTTRDAVDTSVTIGGVSFRLIDTAGLRRKSRIEDNIEYYSYIRTLQAIDRCDVALLLMDATEPFTDQDKKLASEISERGKGIVLLVNKWDLLGKKDELGDVMKRKLKDEMGFVSFAPLHFISALTGRGIQKVPELVLKVNGNRNSRIGTTLLNRLVRDILAFDRLPTDSRGRAFKIFYCTQAEIAPPTFIFFVNFPDLAEKAFENHMEKELRSLADFEGTPLRIFWRGKEEKSS